MGADGTVPHFSVYLYLYHQFSRMLPLGQQRRQPGPSMGDLRRLVDVPNKTGHQGAGKRQTVPWAPVLLWQSCRQGPD